jgi:metal-responsive CopG/Arc/MetJ family transcriptional regulator
MTLIERVNIYVEKDSWEYLDCLSKILDKNRSEIARDIISLYVANLKRVFGDNCQESKAGIINFYSAMLNTTTPVEKKNLGNDIKDSKDAFYTEIAKKNKGKRRIKK